MNDKELLELLKKIKAYCKEKDNCNECKFKTPSADCAFTQIAYLLINIPQDWNIAKIERIIEE